MKKVKMSLAGLDGNAFNLMGQFQRNARRQGIPQEEVKAVLDECRTGDYDHLLQTLMNNIEDPDEN
jgi:ERCC4-related helicase